MVRLHNLAVLPLIRKNFPEGCVPQILRHTRNMTDEMDMMIKVVVNLINTNNK